MPITIQYKGKLKDIKALKQLNAEVSEIGRALKWKPKVVNEYSARKKYLQYEDLVGITLRPEKSDALSLTFLTDGTLMGVMYAAIGNIKEMLEEEYQVSMKTQYAGPEVHIAAIKLLKYLEKKYFESFEVLDETGYWESGDEEMVRSKFPKPVVDEEAEKALSPFDRKNPETLGVVEMMDQALAEKWERLGKG